MERHVLVAMDRTDASDAALEYAFEEYPAARVSVVHVTVPAGPLARFGGRDPCEYVVPELTADRNAEPLPTPDRFTRAQCRRAEGALARAHELAERYDREIEPVVRSGRAATEIAAYADERAVDRIVIADHPATTFRPIFRSVPDAVANTTATPVTSL
ncbi:universal stress protein [Haloterrigena alkaliphila]|uniref:Universal stress protein n=1 Tax=Haloterrigena alkaliphila TaxID=2816475 RepID=A0A8A2VDB3_9EURY|nr:universal stress protein [Haloterrigena alkaliphila]QSW98677.1 universal stress protein [Haloterrigena alkaliphila]